MGWISGSTGSGRDLLSCRRSSSARRPGAEARVVGDLDAVLLGEQLGERRARDVAELHQLLAEPAACGSLLGESVLEACLGEESLFDEELAERPPGDRWSVHGPCIGMHARDLKASRRT